MKIKIQFSDFIRLRLSRCDFKIDKMGFESYMNCGTVKVIVTVSFIV